MKNPSQNYCLWETQLPLILMGSAVYARNLSVLEKKRCQLRALKALLFRLLFELYCILSCYKGMFQIEDDKYILSSYFCCKNVLNASLFVFVFCFLCWFLEWGWRWICCYERTMEYWGGRMGNLCKILLVGLYVKDRIEEKVKLIAPMWTDVNQSIENIFAIL